MVVYEKNKVRRVGWAVLAAVVLFFSVLGFNRSVKRQAKAVEEGFYETFGIGQQLHERLNAARGLAGLAADNRNVASEYEAVRTAYNALYDAVDPAAFFAANEALERAYPALYEALEADGMDESTKAKAGYYVSQLENAQRVIDADDYNDSVTAFRSDVLGSLPGKLLRPFLPEALPELYE